MIYCISDLTLPQLVAHAPHVYFFRPAFQGASTSPPYFVGARAEESDGDLMALLSSISGVTVLPHPRDRRGITDATKLAKIQKVIPAISTGAATIDILGHIFALCPGDDWNPDFHCY